MDQQFRRWRSLSVRSTFIAGLVASITMVPLTRAVASEDSPARPNKDAVAIYAAAQKACEAFHSGHFEMTANYTEPVLATDEERAKQAPGKEHVVTNLPSDARRYNYWFDAEKQRYRIDLLPDLTRERDPKGTKWVMKGERLTSVRWFGFRPPGESSAIRFETANLSELSSSKSHFEHPHSLFNPRILFAISPTPFSRGRPGIGRKSWPEPKNYFNPEYLPENTVVKTLADGNVVVWQRRKMQDQPVDVETEIELNTVNGYLPVRFTVHLDFEGGERRREFETTVDWTKQSEVFVPTRVKAVKAQIVGNQLADEKAELELNWISVNEPIDEEVFTLNKKVIENEEAE